jgi:amidase
MYYFKQETFDKAQAKGPLTEQTYLDALAFIRQATQNDGIDHALNSHDLDALIAPTESAAGMIDLVNGDHHTGGEISSYPAISGYPHLTLPMGQLHGLPVGLSFIGGENKDFELLEMAYCFEQLTPGKLST